MTSLNLEILSNVINRTDFCCLCYKSIEDLNKSVYIKDEVFFAKSTEVMYEVLSTVLGDHVLENIITHVICLQCSEIAINCFKFIQMSRSNIQHLISSIASIQKHTKNLEEDLNDFQTLFLTFDSSDYNVESYYAKTKSCNDPKALFKKCKTLKKRNNQYLKFSEITKNIDNLCSYKCKLCLKLCSTRANFKVHYLWAHAPKDYKCIKCPKSFGKKSFLTRHMKESHCTVVCSLCGKTYTNTYSLRQHEMSHNLYLACTCGKVYKTKHALNNHIKNKLCKQIRKSNAEAKFMCDYCTKKYARKGALSVHIRLEHMNGRAFTCKWCNKKFASVSKLNEHIITHTKEKKFECEQCGGKFGTKIALLHHTRIHTGEKPYKCVHCEMSFISVSRHTEHIKRSHNEPSFECEICHGMFKSKSCLTRHRKIHYAVSSKLYCKPQSLNL